MRDQCCCRCGNSTSRRVCAHIADLEIGVAVPSAWADDVVIVLHGVMESRQDKNKGRTHTDSCWPSTTALRKVCRWKTSPVRGRSLLREGTGKAARIGCVPDTAQRDIKHQILWTEELGNIACG